MPAHAPAHTPATTPTHARTCASGRAEEVFVAPHNARPGALVVLSPGWCRSVRQGGRAGACSKLEAYSKFAGHVGVLTRPGVGGSWFALNACTHTHTQSRTLTVAYRHVCLNVVWQVHVCAAWGRRLLLCTAFSVYFVLMHLVNTCTHTHAHTHAHTHTHLEFTGMSSSSTWRESMPLPCQGVFR